MLTSPLSPPYSQLSGAVIFNLGSSAHSIIWHGPMRLEQPSCFEPTKRIRCPCAVTCGVLFPLAAAALEERPGRDMAGGGEGQVAQGGISHELEQVLALGGADGRVRLSWLDGAHCEHEMSEQRLLPSPYAESRELAMWVHADNGCGSGSGGYNTRAVLALECISAHSNLGLLVGSYAWGAAMWQVAPWSQGGSVLINMWQRGSHPLRNIPPPMDAFAPLLLAVGPRVVDRDSIPCSRDFHAEPADTLGHVLVGAALGWAASSDMATEALVHSFTLSRANCSIGKRYVATADSSGRSVSGDLVCLAASDELLSGCDGQGSTIVWDLSSTQCLLVLRTSAESCVVLNGTTELYIWQRMEPGLCCHPLPMWAQPYCPKSAERRRSTKREEVLIAPWRKQLVKRAVTRGLVRYGSQSMAEVKSLPGEETSDSSEEQNREPCPDSSLGNLLPPCSKMRRLVRRFAY